MVTGENFMSQGQEKIRRLGFNLLQINGEEDDQEWFGRFIQLQNDLTKSLVLIAIMQSQELIQLKESAQMKTFILGASEQKLASIVASFLRTKSLFDFRCEVRGHLGMPRQRRINSQQR